VTVYSRFGTERFYHGGAALVTVNEAGWETADGTLGRVEAVSTAAFAPGGLELVERETGFEPATFCLGGSVLLTEVALARKGELAAGSAGVAGGGGAGPAVWARRVGHMDGVVGRSVMPSRDLTVVDAPRIIPVLLSGARSGS
jgi:hypothetical protein